MQLVSTLCWRELAARAYNKVEPLAPYERATSATMISTSYKLALADN
ncbi:hypothetical protein [Capnocytophaga granulosa]